MTVYAHDASSGQTNEFPKYEEIHGEDPARFIESNQALAEARIRGIRDPELLEAYEDVADQITAGSYRTTILEAIADRKADLGLETDEYAAPTPDTRTDPVPATDGGTELSYSEDDADGAEEPTAPETPDDSTNAKGLAAGEVLVVDRGAKIEYVFPTTGSDSPYLSRAYDVDSGKLWMELEIDEDDYRSRIAKDSERTTIGELDVDVPDTAATNGGDA